MLWTEKAEEIYSTTSRFSDFCHFICEERRDDDFFKQFSIYRGNIMGLESTLVSFFLMGATINEESVKKDMNLLINLFEEWSQKNKKMEE
tara:strand:+ start:267 stop:536 length:270 start_codon:yes stop_codon:yes gene_type:complete